MRSDEMRRMAAAECHWVLALCLPCRLAPLIDKGDGEGVGANDGERGGDVHEMVGEDGLLGVCLVRSVRMRR